MYAPKIRSSVEPEIPGRNMAEIAIIPIRKSLMPRPIKNWPRSIDVLPPCPFSHVIPATSAMPSKKAADPDQNQNTGDAVCRSQQ